MSCDVGEETERLENELSTYVTVHSPTLLSADPGGLGVIILACVSEVSGFDPGLGRWIFFRA